MKKMDFSIIPFHPDDISRDFIITGRISRERGWLAILYELKGPLKELIISPLSDRPKRADGLWEGTCFELFLNPQNSDGYWEFNLSPSGGWNVYRFDSYRQGMREEDMFTYLPISVRSGSKNLRLALELNAEKIIHPDQAVNVAICAVLKSVNGDTTYWSLTHQGSKPDFHIKDGFIIKL